MIHNKYIISVILLSLAFEDILYLSVNVYSLGILLIITFWNIKKQTFFYAAILNLIWFSFPTIKKSMGYADIIVLTCSCNFLKPEKIGLFFIITGISSALYIKIFKKTKIPLIPFILIGFLLS